MCLFRHHTFSLCLIRLLLICHRIVWFVLFRVCLVLFTLRVGSNESVEWLALSWLRRLLLLLEGQRRYLEKIIWPSTTTR